MKVIISFSILALFFLSSCIEIIDDITVNEDGSGTFKYTINLSSSKVKINSILALDSLDGKKVPSINDITVRINRVIGQLKSKDGISNVSSSADYNDFIFKIECDFSSFEDLQDAIRDIIRSESKEKDIPELDEEWLSFKEGKLVRSIPQIAIKKKSDINAEDGKLLRAGTYTSITRFNSEVDQIENNNALLSKNKKAVMIRTDPYSLIQNPNLLDNTIYLVKTD